MHRDKTRRSMLPPQPWTGVTSDSRRVQPGYAFVAIQGTLADGHKFIADALRRGAGSIYSERPLPRPFPVPTFRVRDARKALAVLTAAFYGNPARHLRCIGATGTNGKTTTTTLLQWILNTPKRQAGLMGTVHIDTGEQIENALLTTPDAETLHSGLARMVSSGLEYAIIEISSHGLKQQRVYGIPFRLAIFTNLSADHSDFHPSVEDYVATKAQLFAYIPERGAIVLNTDDPQADYIAQGSKAQQFRFGTEDGESQRADVYADRICHSDRGVESVVHLSSRLRQAVRLNAATRGTAVLDLPKHWELTLPLFGHHNLTNALAAVTAALLEGVPVDVIRDALVAFPGVWRRQQRLAIQRPVIIDDCCHNPGSYAALFEAVKHQPADRLHFVNAIRGKRGEQINRSIATILGEWAAGQPNLHLWITDCTDTASPYDIVSEAERAAFLGTLDQLNVRYRYEPRLLPTLEAVANSLSAHDVAVLAGAHAMDNAAATFLSLWSKRAVS